MRRVVPLFLLCASSAASAQTGPGWWVVDAHKGLATPTELTIELPALLKPIRTERAAYHPAPAGCELGSHVLVVEPEYMLLSEVYETALTETDTLVLQPLRAGATAELPRIEFVGEGFRLDYHSMATLEHIKAFLELNPTVQLALRGKADGEDPLACERHGRERARSVWEYLVTEGVTPLRLSLEGACTTDQTVPNIAVKVRAI